ncbi:hypothetical protein LTR62_008001 [Meristemomyces frigidus]|uniref:Uncharacterized protein n=1 Tax=Meristemomyces frigidus TaxID=1508187 RepID=A0AAN7YJ08_9PEZI|nr:hypothetical protein LTR62_008001 [Meristemomyces frigidus]
MPRISSRKEPKETVVYPSSNLKTTAFKPLRPAAKIPRTPTTESESSNRPAKIAKRKVSATDETDDGDEADAVALRPAKKRTSLSDSEEDLEDNPLASRPQPKSRKKEAPPAITKEKNKATALKNDPARAKLPVALSISSNDSLPPSSPPPLPTENIPPPPTQLEDAPNEIPAPLLTRLLHEQFASQATKIDRHALKVLQKYMEVFVRESIARTALAKREKGGVEDDDRRWLELEDLEAVAAGVLLDF